MSFINLADIKQREMVPEFSTRMIPSESDEVIIFVPNCSPKMARINKGYQNSSARECTEASLKILLRSSTTA